MTPSAMDVDRARKRCLYLLNESVPSLPPSKISPSSKLTLHRLLSSELRFLSSISSSPSPSSTSSSLNLGYLDAIVTTIHHPSVHTITRVCKPVATLHVDIACTFSLSPSWFFVSHRNPNFILPSSLTRKLHKILDAAHSTPSLKPELVFFVFAKGVPDDVADKLVNEFKAKEIDLLGFGRVFEMRLGFGERRDCKARVLRGLEFGDLTGGDGFGDVVSLIRVDEGDEGVEMVNFDTTALVALVSGISNGGCERLMKAPEEEMRARFKGNYQFVIAQVTSELEHPILTELGDVIAGKKGIICESVCSEFKELILMCGGPSEKLRADLLLKHLLVVPDSPSDRVAVLPTTRKIALKNKVVFGTGDYWHAPTLTANMGFVRAISQTGMSLFTIEHRPRALTGD